MESSPAALTNLPAPPPQPHTHGGGAVAFGLRSPLHFIFYSNFLIF